MYFKRQRYLDMIYSALDTHKLILLYGARQVGKTTLLKIILEDKSLQTSKYYINFDDIYEKTFRSKNEFINYLSFSYNIDFSQSGILFLDEIQTVDNIEQILKSLYDDTNIKLTILATGSGLRHIKKLSSTLVGRIKEIPIYPFSFYEFLETKNIDTSYLIPEKYELFMYEKIQAYLEEFYTFGGYPAVALSKTKEEKIEKLAEIIEVYLKKDISLLIQKDELILFKKLFSYLSNNIAEKLNISDLSTYLQITRKKVEKYIKILERSFLLYPISPFYSNTRKEQKKQQEIFLGDLGIVHYFRNNFSFNIFDGKLVEHFVFNELQKNKGFLYDEIKYYSKNNGSEIDFIYQKKAGGIIPIEVKLKNSDTIPKIFSSFIKDYRDNIIHMIKTSTSYVGERNLEEKKVKVLPFWMRGRL